MLRKKTALSATQIQAAPSQACIVTRGTEGFGIRTANRTYEIPPAIPPCIDNANGVGDAYRQG